MDFAVQDVIYYDRKRLNKYLSLYCILLQHFTYLQHFTVTNVPVDFSNDLEGLHHSMKDTSRGKGEGVLGSKTLKEDVLLIAQPGPGPLSTTFSSRPSPVLVRT